MKRLGNVRLTSKGYRVMLGLAHAFRFGAVYSSILLPRFYLNMRNSPQCTSELRYRGTHRGYGPLMFSSATNSGPGVVLLLLKWSSARGKYDQSSSGIVSMRSRHSLRPAPSADPGRQGVE